jgi:hypothetical protein
MGGLSVCLECVEARLNLKFASGGQKDCAVTGAPDVSAPLLAQDEDM